jgi:hypothetical protein
MSSRQEEKAQRRAEREAAEAAAAARAARGQRLRMAGAGAVVIAVIVVAVVLIAGSGGGGSSDDTQSSVENAVPIPPAKEKNLQAAAKAAGCKLLNPAMEGREHVTGTVTYKNSNPPASGPHNPVPAEDGIYAPGNEPAKEHWVHTLEHGRIEIQYAPGTSKHVQDQLETLGSEKFNGTAGYHVLVFENNTKMPYKVAAVAWTHVLGCPTMNNGVFDAIRDFRNAYTDKGPELIP